MTVTQSRLGFTRVEDLAWLVHAEFREMPGMRLTFAQVQRLWDLSTDDCQTILDFLLSSGILAQDEDDRFCRFES